jgi:hypothetical protein
LPDDPHPASVTATATAARPPESLSFVISPRLVRDAA